MVAWFVLVRQRDARFHMDWRDTELTVGTGYLFLIFDRVGYTFSDSIETLRKNETGTVRVIDSVKRPRARARRSWSPVHCSPLDESATAHSSSWVRCFLWHGG